MATKIPHTLSDLPIPPGETLAEELEARGMTQRELSARLGRPARAINEIIRGKKSITPDTAIALSKVLGGEAQFWTNLESHYRLTLAQARDRQALAIQEQWLGQYPVAEMIRRGWLEAGTDKPGRLYALLSFLGVASIEPKLYQDAIGFRITDAARPKVSPGALAVWLRKGELDARAIRTADYDAATFHSALTAIRGMTELPPEEFVPAMTQLCAAAGVAFCLVPEFPKIGANGVARWLTDRKALIQMNFRNKGADVFWFSFFHEAGHLLLHRTPRRIIIDGLDADPGTAEIEAQAEADRFAADFLIPPEDWSNFCDAGDFAPSAVSDFARSIGIAPFTVAGRLQKEKRVAYNQLAELKRRYEW